MQQFIEKLRVAEMKLKVKEEQVEILREALKTKDELLAIKNEVLASNDELLKAVRQENAELNAQVLALECKCFLSVPFAPRLEGAGVAVDAPPPG